MGSITKLQKRIEKGDITRNEIIEELEKIRVICKPQEMKEKLKKINQEINNIIE